MARRPRSLVRDGEPRRRRTSSSSPGPSRTSDIEQRSIRGVHAPRRARRHPVRRHEGPRHRRLRQRSAPRLACRACERAGHELRGLARDPSRVRADMPGRHRRPGHRASASRRRSTGVDVAYYLIHSMETSADGGLRGPRAAVAAQRFADAAHAAGRRAGRLPRRARARRRAGLAPPRQPAGGRAHCCSRPRPRATALRASIVIGARSRSFRFLVRLVERLPRGAAAGLARAPHPADRHPRHASSSSRVRSSADAAAGRSLDIAGPDVLTYGEMIERIARPHARRARRRSRSALASTPVAARVAAAVAGEDPELIGPLMEGLGTDLLPRDDGGGAGCSACACTASTPPSSARCATGRRAEELAAR